MLAEVGRFTMQAFRFQMRLAMPLMAEEVTMQNAGSRTWKGGKGHGGPCHPFLPSRSVWMPFPSRSTPDHDQARLSLYPMQLPHS